MALRRDEVERVPHDPEKRAEHQKQADEVRAKAAEQRKRVFSGLSAQVGAAQPIQPKKLTPAQMATRHVAARIQLQAGNPEGASETLANAGIGVRGKKKKAPAPKRKPLTPEELLALEEVSEEELAEYDEVDEDEDEVEEDFESPPPVWEATLKALDIAYDDEEDE